MVFITVEKKGCGHYVIHDDYGHKEQYLYWNKRSALRAFKREHGYRYKRDVLIIEI